MCGKVPRKVLHLEQKEVKVELMFSLFNHQVSGSQSDAIRWYPGRFTGPLRELKTNLLIARDSKPAWKKRINKESICLVWTTAGAGPVMTLSKHTSNLDHRGIAAKTMAKLVAWQNHSPYLYIKKMTKVGCSMLFLINSIDEKQTQLSFCQLFRSWTLFRILSNVFPSCMLHMCEL